jgi:hypothetical protein
MGDACVSVVPMSECEAKWNERGFDTKFSLRF